jgi:multidrug transporter EmrE-like cation transporter
MHWFYLLVAVIANIATNLLLKKTMRSIEAPLGVELARQAVLSPWLWGAFVAGGLLLLSYILAIRTMDLSLSYAIVTSAALLGITFFAWLVFHEPLTVTKIFGVLLIIGGIILVTR